MFSNTLSRAACWLPTTTCDWNANGNEHNVFGATLSGLRCCEIGRGQGQAIPGQRVADCKEAAYSQPTWHSMWLPYRCTQSVAFYPK